MDRVQPMSRPAFAVTRRREQSVNKLFVSALAFVAKKVFDLVRRGRQAGQIKTQSPDQSAPIRFRRRRHFFRFEFGQHKQINRIARPILVFHLWQRGTGSGFETPPIGFVGRLGDGGFVGPGCALINPRAQKSNLLRRQPPAFFWHDQIFFQSSDEMNHPAFGAATGNDGRPGSAAFQRGGFHIPAQIIFLLVRSVAGVAMLREDGLNIVDEIHPGLRGRRAAGGRTLLGERTSRQRGKSYECLPDPCDHANMSPWRSHVIWVATRLKQMSPCSSWLSSYLYHCMTAHTSASGPRSFPIGSV